MVYVEEFFPEKGFGGFTRNDTTVEFYLRVNALLHSDMAVLDVGCGRGACVEDPVLFHRELRILKGKVARVVGLDVDPVAANNPVIDEFLLLETPQSKWPLPNDSVELIVSDWTLEHVSNPDFFFSEAYRVLKPGGYFCARTTNAWGYVAVATRLIPEKFHRRVVQYVQKIRKEEDIFPTVYKCNTIPTIKKMLRRHGFAGVVYAPVGAPGYLNFSRVAYFLGMMYEHFSPQWLRHTLLIFAKKKD